MSLGKYIIIGLIMLPAIGTIAQTHLKLGRIDVYDDDFRAIADTNCMIEILAESLEWAEGPVWVHDDKFLLCSDPKRNTIYKWSAEQGFQSFFSPSGFTGKGRYSDEPGSNGLLINHSGELVACEHGDRRISKMNLQNGYKETIASSWDGKRFNSPNDICQSADGTYYFTDPPYGLPDRENDIKNREIGKNGVYKISTNGQVQQIISNLDKPNGIALSPDESELYVALSDSQHPYLMSYELEGGSVVGEGKILFDFGSNQLLGNDAAPDGIKVDEEGNIFMAAGEGIVVINGKGKLLGRIFTGVQTANCAFGSDDWLYITASNYLLRIKIKTAAM